MRCAQHFLPKFIMGDMHIALTNAYEFFGFKP